MQRETLEAESSITDAPSLDAARLAPERTPTRPRVERGAREITDASRPGGRDGRRRAPAFSHGRGGGSRRSESGPDCVSCLDPLANPPIHRRSDLSVPAAARRDLPRLTDRLELGSGGLRVSPFCIGMVEKPETIGEAFDLGVNFFFVSADMHWPLYEATRRGLSDLLARGRGVRDQIVVAGVCYPTQPEFCAMPFRELVESLPRLERLDVLLAGGAYGHEVGRRLSVYEEHRKSGFLGNRAIGASFHD